jgi:hypothetical protein
MKPATLHALVKLLRQLLDDVAEAETPTSPTPQPPIVPPQQGDHRPYLRADMSPCCAKHDDDFTSRNRRINRFVIDLLRAPEPNPALTQQAREYIQARLGDRRP